MPKRRARVAPVARQWDKYRRALRLQARASRHMTVTRADLERQIARLQAEVSDPRAGIYGPSSAAWLINKETALFLGGGKAALLQLAHPFVAHAVDQHSATRTDPLGRFQRTFDSVFAMVFGDLDQAMRRARRVHAIHSRISGEIREDVGRFRRGTGYQANDEAALMWVHATLLHTAVEMYELVLGPLESREKERYYQESRRFAALFGIPDSVQPESWAAFDAYYRAMLASDTIVVGEPAREMGRFLFASPSPIFRPLFRWLSIMTAGLMPERLRGEFGFVHGRPERAVFDVSVAALRRGYPLLPPRLRYIPAYISARRRLAGVRGPDHVGRWLEKLATLPLAPRTRPV
jgi:uncharacterized protein (DUF2236 family)